MERNQSVEERVREWLSENRYDYVVKTYQPGETVVDCAEKDKENISWPWWKMQICLWSSL